MSRLPSSTARRPYAGFPSKRNLPKGWRGDGRPPRKGGEPDSPQTKPGWGGIK